MGGKPRPPKHPGDEPERSGKRKIIWQGRQNAGLRNDTRIIAIDADSQDGLPCQMIVEYAQTDGLSKITWREPSAYTGMTWLEKKLALELASRSFGMLPKWATKKGENEWKEVLIAWGKKLHVYNNYRVKEQERINKEAAEEHHEKRQFERLMTKDVPQFAPEDNDDPQLKLKLNTIEQFEKSRVYAKARGDEIEEVRLNFLIKSWRETIS